MGNELSLFVEWQGESPLANPAAFRLYRNNG